MINKRLEYLTSRNSAIRAMFEEGARLAEKYGSDNVYDFSLGNPCTEPPILVKDSIVGVLNNSKPMNVHGYMPNAGYEFVREEVAKKLSLLGKLSFSASNIVMTVGAAGGLNCILQTLLNDEDEVVVIAPFFVEYINYIENWGGKVVVAKADEDTFYLSITNIEKCITSRTKAIIINNPNNPTGVVYSEDNIKELAHLLKKKQNEYNHPIYIISDEPYRELVYDGVRVPFIPDFYDNTIVVYSWSKSLSLPGERIGYLAISPVATDANLIFKAATISNRIIGFVNAPSLLQHVVCKCLNCEPDISLYEKNRAILYENLVKIGYKCVFPQGAFYLWLKTPCDEQTFVEKAKQFNILLVGGKAFYGNGYVRIAYCVPNHIVKKSISSFQALWDALK